MGKITSAIKNFRWGYLFIAVLLCTLGILCFVFQEKFLQTIGYIVGGSVLLFGIVLAIKILAERQRVLTIICGITSMILNDQAITVYPMFIGLFIVIDGSFKLQTVINAKRYKMKMWWFLLIFSCLTIASGFLLIKDEADNIVRSVIVMGVALCLSGLGNLFSLFYFGTIMKRAVAQYKQRYENHSEDALVADTYDNVASSDKEQPKEAPLATIERLTDAQNNDDETADDKTENINNNNDLPAL